MINVKNKNKIKYPMRNIHNICKIQMWNKKVELC